MALAGPTPLSIEKRRLKAFFCKIFDFECLTYAQKQKVTLSRRACCTAAKPTSPQNRKSLISLIFLTCTLDEHFVGKLDFQGFQTIETEFSTKLSTDFLDQAQSSEKSTTYILFQEIG